MGYYEDLFSQEEANRHMRKNAREEGLAEGMEKGRAEGMEKGRAEGMEKGRAEVAARLLADGMEPEKVAELTGLGIEEIMKLRARNRKEFSPWVDLNLNTFSNFPVGWTEFSEPDMPISSFLSTKHLQK